MPWRLTKPCRPPGAKLWPIPHLGLPWISKTVTEAVKKQHHEVSKWFNHLTFIDWNSFGQVAGWWARFALDARSVKGQLYTWGKGPATGFDVEDVITTPRQAGGGWTDEPPTSRSSERMRVTCHLPLRPQVKLESRDPVYQIAAGPLHTVGATLELVGF